MDYKKKYIVLKLKFCKFIYIGLRIFYLNIINQAKIFDLYILTESQMSMTVPNCNLYITEFKSCNERQN